MWCCMLQADDAIVWELLGHATRIWHIASGQLGPQEERVQQAADIIFNYWSSRKAWLVRDGLSLSVLLVFSFQSGCT